MKKIIYIILTFGLVTHASSQGLSSISAGGAKPKKSPMELFIGTIQTQAKESALSFSLEYAEKLNTTEAIKVHSTAKSIYLFDYTPHIAIKTGDDDSFSSITAKLTGNFMIFHKNTTPVYDDDGNVLPFGKSGGSPDTSRYFSVIPISAGFETDRNFDNINAIVEIGFVPWYQNSNRLRFLHDKKRGIDSKVGFFLQAGYKFKLSDPSLPAVSAGDGSVDQSSEAPNSGILRLKAQAEFTREIKLFGVEKLTFDVTGFGTVWYDLVNSEAYYNYGLKASLPLNEKTSWDLKWERGSGAPNFNEGDQFGTGLSIKF